MAEIDVLKAQIVRQDLSTTWGFRLQGGADQGEPLAINRLTPGSPAARIGLKSGDEVTEIGDLQTEGLTHQQALELIAQYGDTLVLTVERRAKGTVPTNTVLSRPDTEPLKNYQTYNMAGGQPSQRPVLQIGASSNQNPNISDDHVVTAGPVIFAGTSAKPEIREEAKFYQTYDLNGPRAPVPSQPQHDYQFQTVRARPFEDQPKPYYSPQSPEPPQPQPQSPPLSPPHQHYSPPPQQYSPASYNQYNPEYPDYPAADPAAERDDVTQSRTFRVLQSLMSSEEPSAGVQGLPPPRSASQEQWKAEQAAKRNAPRVKVFMPQQYNSPLGMYSAKNVVETFQAQAETMMDAMENRPGFDGPVSDVQRALMES